MSVNTTLDNHVSTAKRTEAGQAAPDYQREGIRRFNESMEDMAGALGDLSRPMRRSAHDRGRLAVEDVYAGMWQRMKRELCGGDAEAAKHMIRQEGCSAYFMSAIHSITTTNVGYNPRSRDDQAQRFSVALRLAVHLSPDNGAAIYEQLDNALCTKRHPYSLAIVNAYLAFKAHQYEANRL